MLQDDLIRDSGVGMADCIVVLDRDGLWQKSGAMEAVALQSYHCVMADDSILLRYAYESHIVKADEKLFVCYTGKYVPYDILIHAHIVDVSLQARYPYLVRTALRNVSPTELELVRLAYPSLHAPMSLTQTQAFVEKDIWSVENIGDLAAAYCGEIDRLASGQLSHFVWMKVADMLGFILMALRMGASIAGYDHWYARLQARFAAWMDTEYRFLSSTPCRQQPLIMSQMLDYVRRQSSKIAIIVMDGMSFADFHVLAKSACMEQLRFFQTGMFSFVPSITSAARQALFSGKLPIEHAKPFSLENEEKQWRAYWREYGYADAEIAFCKTETPSWSSYTKILGIVINQADDMMHSELQGGKGMLDGMTAWAQTGRLADVMSKLLRDGFAVYVTADHGNTTAIAQGRFLKPSVVTENASRRAVIYKDFAGAEELAKFKVRAYHGAYMPTGYRYFTFEPGACYGDRDAEYVSHGGRTIEEMIVPFIKAEAQNG